MMRALRPHLGPFALFAALTIAWTWPLSRHLRDALPGGPGDNYSFVWNLWWMRHVLSTPGLAYFHTSYLFYPFGTTIADHPHTALPGFIAATLLRRASVVTAQNLLLLSYVFANMACAYALVWDVLTTTFNAEREENAVSGWREVSTARRGAVLGGLIFGLSPYLASHLLGHFDLVAAWEIPLFALAVRRAVAGESIGWATGAGVVLAATTYTAYYYVVYLAFFLAVYLCAWLDWRPVAWRRRAQTRATRSARLGLMVAMTLLASFAIWIVATGGRAITVGNVIVSIRAPQNALTGIWICAMAYALCEWSVRFTGVPIPRERLRVAVTTGAWISVVFAAGAAPLLWQAVQLVVSGEYVTPAYQWRSAPRGVDLIAPLLGPPLASLSGRIYAAAHLDRIEAVGWLGIVPLALTASALLRRSRVDRELRIWRAVAAAFAVWALGPILTVGGFDTGMKLPAILLRYVPFVANARMPGRAIVGVFMALAVLAATGLGELAAAPRWRRWPALPWLAIAVVVVEFWNAPIPLTPLDRPDVYRVLAAAPAGAVCEVPFGIGDGLGVGIGSQERVSLYYATLHEHPLVGGYIGRMPADAGRRYERMAVAGTLLDLSDGKPAAAVPGIEESPCVYLVVKRAATPAVLDAYVRQLPLDRIGSDAERDLYRISSPR